jgi:hypothetical protein
VRRRTHVKGNDEKHRFLEKHREWFQNRSVNHCSDRFVFLLVHRRVPSLIPGFLPQSFRFGVENVRDVGFWEKEDDSDAAYSGEDEEYPEDPTEIGVCNFHESRDDRGEGGTGERHKTISSNGFVSSVYPL